MLDQNTDRMWYVIGAVLIGAAIIFGMNTLMPGAFASVGGMFENFIENVPSENLLNQTPDDALSDMFHAISTEYDDYVISEVGVNIYTHDSSVEVDEYGVLKYNYIEHSYRHPMFIEESPSFESIEAHGQPWLFNKGSGVSFIGSYDNVTPKPIMTTIYAMFINDSMDANRGQIIGGMLGSPESRRLEKNFDDGLFHDAYGDIATISKKNLKINGVDHLLIEIILD